MKPGDVVAVIGTGPVGLAAIATAGLYGPSRVIAVDIDANRVEQARRFGATDGVVSTSSGWREEILAMTDGLGVDVAIEAVGIPDTFQMCLDIVRPAGHVANVGVHGKPVELPIQDLWISNIVMSMGLVNTNTLGTLLKLVAQRRIDRSRSSATDSGSARSSTLRRVLPCGRNQGAQGDHERLRFPENHHGRVGPEGLTRP